MLHYATLCYATLHYAILYYTILYYTILYYTIILKLEVSVTLHTSPPPPTCALPPLPPPHLRPLPPSLSASAARPHGAYEAQ
jgi:hypothetical protein